MAAAPINTRPQPAKGDDGGTIDTKQSQNRQALGRSRGGLTTKLHLLVEARVRHTELSGTP
ncbi:hypothetical protein GCM10023096_66060 [Nonomuraea ferruginea]